MLKKLLSFWVILALLLIGVPQKTAAATLTWEAMVNSTFSSGVRSPGFGDENNILAISMVTFNDYVYVSNVTTNTGTEIWRSANGTDWEQANEDGFGDAGEASYAILGVFDGHLYAFNYFFGEDHVDVYRYSSGTVWTNTATIGNDNTPMYEPAAAIVYDNTLFVSLVTEEGLDDESAFYKSTDGTTWVPDDIDGFGGTNEVARALAVYNNYLYAGTYNSAGAEVWRYNGSNWVIDNEIGFGDIENIGVGTLTSFGGALYATTNNTTTGSEVWRSSGGGTTDWTKVSDLGFGQGTDADYTYGSAVFKNKLYIGTGNAKVFRSSDGTTYEQVNDDGFGYDDNLMAIFSVLGDYLYAGTGTIVVGGRIVQPGPNTTEVYRYYEPSTELPQTGADL